jgi:hypothetical protein
MGTIKKILTTFMNFFDGSKKESLNILQVYHLVQEIENNQKRIK